MRVTRLALPDDLEARIRHLRRAIGSGNTPGPDARGELARCMALSSERGSAEVTSDLSVCGGAPLAGQPS